MELKKLAILFLIPVGGCQNQKEPTVVPQSQPKVEVIVVKQPTIESERLALIELYKYTAENFSNLKEGMEYIKPNVKKIVQGPNYKYWQIELEKVSNQMYSDYKQRSKAYDIFMNAAKYLEQEE